MNIPITKKKKLDDKLISENILLDTLQIDSLTNILFNYHYIAKNIVLHRSMRCYYPHNAIIFLDTNNKVIEFIEICFTCIGNKKSSDKINIGDFGCYDKYLLLKNVFINSGIKKTEGIRIIKRKRRRR